MRVVSASRSVVPRLLFAAALPCRNQNSMYQFVRRARLPTACDSPPAGTPNNDGGGFGELGLNPLLLPPLAAAGIEQPTEVQRAAFEMILSGNDAVLLSETGTGKTLAYALPLIHQLIEQAAMRDAGEAADDAATDGGGESRLPYRRTPINQALVLVPNRDLAAQVYGVMDGIVSSLPETLQDTLRVSSLVSEVGADADANILISTPAIALKLWRGPEQVRWVVMDEADALLAGSWKVSARAQYPIEQIVAQVKRAAKEESRRESDAPLVKPKLGREGRRESRDQARYASRQFVVTGATMPNAGTKNMEEHVKRLFPNAQWFLAERVHRSVAAVKHLFVKIDADRRGSALQQALRYGPGGRVLIFANTLEMAEAAHSDACLELGTAGCAIFHAGLPAYEREETLAAFGRGQPAALVCTVRRRQRHTERNGLLLPPPLRHVC